MWDEGTIDNVGVDNLAKDQNAPAVVLSFKAVREGFGGDSLRGELRDDGHGLLTEAEDAVHGSLRLPQIAGLDGAAAEENGGGGVADHGAAEDGVEAEEIGDVIAGGSAAVAVLESVGATVPLRRAHRVR